MLASLDGLTPRFLARTSGGVCLNQPVSRDVSFSGNAPWSKTIRNSLP